MLLHRRILFVFACLLVLGSIGVTGGYAYYLRSDGYREGVARDVGTYLTLPTDIDAVTPLSHRSRAFTGVRLHLPGGDVQIFQSDRVVWREDERDGVPVNMLDVYNGWLLLGSDQIGRDDYKQLLQGSLAHDFTELNLAGVEFHNIDIRWHQPGLELETAGASGMVSFDADGFGRANLSSNTLNHTQVDEPIAIQALFVPGSELEFRHIALTVPRIPLASLALDDMLGAEVSKGWFDGTVSFKPTDARQVYTLRGSVGEARLEDLTRRLPTGPVRGRIDVRLSEAQVSPGELIALAFDGRVDAVQVGDIAKYFGAADLSGVASVRVRQCRYDAGRLDHLSASADATDVPADAITRLVGRGKITGIARVRVNAIEVADDELRHADIDIDVQPRPGEPGLIDREVILNVARDALGVDLGSIGNYLPDTVEYARMGCKLIVDGDELTVKGSHGSDGKTILTVKVLGRDVGVLSAPRQTFAVGPIIEKAREQIAKYDVREYLKKVRK